MTRVFFPCLNEELELADRLAEGDTVTPALVALGHAAMLNRLRSRIAWRRDKGTLASEAVAAEALRQWTDMRLEDGIEAEVDDSVETEAIAIAKELIMAQLTAQGLSAPKGLEEHCKALARESEAIRDKAKARVEARRAVALAAVRDVSA